MKIITSRDNPLYKELKHLATSAQARRKAATTLLDGVHLCQAYLDTVGQPVWCVVNDASQHHPEVAQLIARSENCLILADVLYQSLSQVEHGVGIFFVMQIAQTVMPDQIAETAVVLENLQDPGNLGSLLRSAAAAGIRKVFCSPATVSAWSPKVLRAGMGAHFLMEIHEQADLHSLLKQSSLPILATSSYASKTIYECDLKKNVIWMFGHEGQGISDQLMHCATDKVKIPHLGNIESLNVAACAAVCFLDLCQK